MVFRLVVEIIREEYIIRKIRESLKIFFAWSYDLYFFKRWHALWKAIEMSDNGCCSL